MKELLPRQDSVLLRVRMDVPTPRSLLAIAITIEGRSTIDVSTGQEISCSADDNRRPGRLLSSSTGFTASPLVSDENCQ